MNFRITEWHEQNKNDWCALDRKSHKLIDRDDNLLVLRKRLGTRKVVFTKAWMSGIGQQEKMLQ